MVKSFQKYNVLKPEFKIVSSGRMSNRYSVYSPNRYKLPNYYIFIIKLLYVSYIFIVLRCVTRTPRTFKTEFFATLVKG